ncbi:MAG TPA: tetrahydromethanopterin S-methyltransferase subunit A [Methanosarcinales archaeon]|nr:tetrahydromethanopterin S-methyltransferase subunit A [Methanosarcinales archaeon]
MANKVASSDPWPIITGEFSIGNPEDCVAVITCGSHLSDFPLTAGASITGPCKTENIGIEKVVANVVSNPNIRFLIVTGMEVKGHITGQAVVAFHQNGIDAEGRIVGAVGAIPFIQNLNEDAIKRFQEQIELVDLIDTEDEGKISAAVKACAAKDPGALDVEPMVIKIEEEGGEEEIAGFRPMAAEVATIRARIKEMEAAMIATGNLNKYAAGVYTGKIEGILIGLTLTLVILGLVLMGKGTLDFLIGGV